MTVIKLGRVEMSENKEQTWAQKPSSAGGANDCAPDSVLGAVYWDAGTSSAGGGAPDSVLGAVYWDTGIKGVRHLPT